MSPLLCSVLAGHSMTAATLCLTQFRRNDKGSLRIMHAGLG